MCPRGGFSSPPPPRTLESTCHPLCSRPLGCRGQRLVLGGEPGNWKSTDSGHSYLCLLQWSPKQHPLRETNPKLTCESVAEKCPGPSGLLLFPQPQPIIPVIHWQPQFEHRVFFCMALAFTANKLEAAPIGESVIRMRNSGPVTVCKTCKQLKGKQICVEKR